MSTEHTQRRFRAARVRALLAGLALLLVAACGRPPQAAPANQRLISSLRTALSVQRLDWLEQNVQEIDSRRAEGQMSEAEYRAFSAIIAKAKAGQWKEAEQDAVAFQKAQRPTAEQIERLPKPKQP